MVIRAEDGLLYVAKFAGNPKGTRSLVNEWVAYQLLARLGVCTPALSILQLTSRAQPVDQFYIQEGSERVPIRRGFHLGSLLPEDPEANAIWDFLPRTLLPYVVNIDDFATLFVFHQWVCHTGRPQAVFLRENNVPPHRRYRAYFIDHSLIFAGRRWELRDNFGCDLYFDKGVYQRMAMANLCTQAIEKIEDLAETDVLSIVETVPKPWLTNQDDEALPVLFQQLNQRRRTLRSAISREMQLLKQE